MDDKFKYYIDDKCDVIIEECQNQFTALRRLKWGDEGEYRLELRRWRNNPDGTEFPAKGCTFMTEDGPTCLAESLIQLGYGRTKECLESLYARDDFRKALNSVVGKDDELYDEEAGEVDDDYFDPKTLLNL